MAEDCNPLVRDDFAYPLRPSNRPGLDHIRYRIGRYPDMVEALVRHIDREVALAAWTHRDADDPAIALLQGAGMLGEILSFYQERYANEAYLGTADWRESIADLVRLTGYRMTPAIGGRATLAVEVKPGRPVTVPAGFPLKADLEADPKPAEFQTDADLIAWPHLSKFNLYRERHYAGHVSSNATLVEVHRAGASTAPAAIAALELKAGDRLMLLPDAPGWVSSGSSISAQQKRPQVLKVKSVETVLDRTILTFDTPFAESWSTPVRAYRLGRTFRHLGHAAPATLTENVKDSSGVITGAREKATGYRRHVDNSHDCNQTSADRDLWGTEIPLDQEVQDLAVGGQVIVETLIRNGGDRRRLAVRRKIARLTHLSMGFAQQTAATTMLRMGAALIRHNGLGGAEADIRDYRIHEVTSPRIQLRPRAVGYGGHIWNGTEALWFFGTRDQVRALAGRRLTLQNEEEGRVETLICVNEPGDFTGGGSLARMWPLSFEAPPKRFLRSDFKEETPEVAVYGNLVEVSEGKAVPLTVLGNGDGRASFQTFKLPKPLTYHLAPGAAPPQRPELDVYVENRLWSRVSSLFGQAPDAQVYIVREDADGNSWIQFGDGTTGARLPSGIGNVAAAMRTGAGARGPLKAGADPSPGERLAEIKKLKILEGVFGGADAEEGGNARIAAPGKVQGLDRLVSVSDYESELLSIPGVARVRADWDIVDGVPGVVLRVLLEAGREAEFEAVRATIANYQKCRGPNRFALFVEQAFLRQVYVDLSYGLDPRFLADEVESAIIAALAPMDAEQAQRMGLFALGARRLGGPEYASRIEAVVNELPGVTHVRVSAFGYLPASGQLPPAPRPLAARLSPPPHQLLALTRAALGLSSAPPAATGECA